MNQDIALSSQSGPIVRSVNWPRVALFVGLTFALTWLLDVGLYLAGGLTSPAASVALVTQMLIPAFFAILLETFVFTDSRLYFRVYRGPARWFTYYFLGSTLLLIAGTIAMLTAPALVNLVATIQAVLVIVGSLVIIGARWRGGKETYSGVGMAGGAFRWWLILGLGLLAYFALSTLLNAVFKLGNPVDLSTISPEEVARGWSPFAIQASMFFNFIILGPLLNMMGFFGEEYGWRGFLQRSLEQMGRVKATLLVGAIWGIWHFPLILMGYNYPGTPILGMLLMTIFCIEFAFFLAYAVYKSKGVWTAAFLHAINNNAVPFFFGVIFLPSSKILSFGMGVFGLTIMAVIVLFLLRDPLWKNNL